MFTCTYMYMQIQEITKKESYKDYFGTYKQNNFQDYGHPWHPFSIRAYCRSVTSAIKVYINITLGSQAKPVFTLISIKS